MAQDWDIRSRGTKCNACEKGFEDAQTFHSSLTFGEEGYQRTDFCQTCWDAGQKDIPSVVSYWLGKFKSPPPPAEEAVKKETAESLLRKLMEEDDPDMHNVIFILAVMLERKRILVERDVHTRENDQALVRVYEHRLSGETFLVVDPKLSLTEIEPVQIQVINLLGGPRTPKAPDGSNPTQAAPTAEPMPESVFSDA
ncbi:MAG: hypothetical protein O3C57_01340 [Verrucomicrobia bacterium]|nr:hypothetical protein [Verrucomicrobiota bacterium]